MAEVYIYSNSPVYHSVYWKGVLTDPDNSPVVDIYDITEDPAVTPPIDPGHLIASLVAEKMENDLGTYAIYLPLEFTTRTRQLRSVWHYEVDGNPIEKELFEKLLLDKLEPKESGVLIKNFLGEAHYRRIREDLKTVLKNIDKIPSNVINYKIHSLATKNYIIVS